MSLRKLLQWKYEGPQIVLLVALIGISALAWGAAPDALPVHWNINGEVDRYGSKAEGLLLTPGIALGLYVLMAALPLLDPRREAYASFAVAYTTIRVAMLVMLGAVHGAMVLTALGYAVPMDHVIPALIGLLFVTIGLVIGRVQPNWFVGVRTPWTLSSPTAWAQTHQASRWVFVAGGVAFLVTAAAPSLVTVLSAVGIVLVGTLGLVVYSYVVWRQADDHGRRETGSSVRLG